MHDETLATYLQNRKPLFENHLYNHAVCADDLFRDKNLLYGR